MDQGQYIEIVGMANAAHLRDVVLPRCERRMNDAREVRGLRGAATSPAARSVLARLGDRLRATGERLRARGPSAVAPGAPSR